MITTEGAHTMKTADLTVGTVYVHKPYKYSKPYPVRLLHIGMWGDVELGTGIGTSTGTYSFLPLRNRPTAYVGMLVARHVRPEIGAPEFAGELAALPMPDFHELYSTEKLTLQAAVYASSLPEGIRLGVVNNRNLVGTWSTERRPRP